MSASPWPHLSAERPRSIYEHMVDAAQRTAEQNPEAVALGNSVGAALAEYLDGAITLREFARRHTPFERFRAVRVWGPDDERFKAIMPVLDDLIALHRTGKSPERPERVGVDVPTVAATGRYPCANCRREEIMRAGRPQMCGKCREGMEGF
jgi:hypothetical protein